MSVLESNYGVVDSKIIKSYTITNKNNLKMQIITYGGIITSIWVPDKKGKFDDVVLGYDSLSDYQKGDKFFGALIGRCGNRIRNSKFILNKKEYVVQANDGKNHLHGGDAGFHTVVWKGEILNNKDNTIRLTYLSKDMEGGYPGNLHVAVEYSLTDNNELVINYSAISDKDTVCNLTNHSYFNLLGHASGNILNHKLMVNASNFTPNDSESVPTGEIKEVANTPMDFRKLKRIGEDIDADYEQIKFGNGYDHNWLLDSKGDINILSAELVDEVSGRAMDMYTTNVGVQIYSGNFLDGSDIGKGKVAYEKRSGICLETQFVPNAVNDSRFESPVIKANKEYNQTTMYKFYII